MKEVLTEVDSGRDIGFDLETYGPSIKHKASSKPDSERHQIAGMGFAFESGKRYYVPVAHKGPNNRQWRTLLAPLRSPRARVWVHNWKFELAVVGNQGVVTKCVLLDSQICAWMSGWRLNGKKGLKLKPLVQEHFGESPKTFEEVANGRSMDALTAAEAADYCGDDAYNCLRLGQKAWAFMLANDLTEPYLNIEQPIIAITRHMESTGLPIDRGKLQQARVQCLEEATALSSDFTALTEHELPMPTKVRKQRVCDECGGTGEASALPAGPCVAVGCAAGLLWFKNGKPRMHTVLEDRPALAGADIGSSQQVARWLFDSLGWWPTEDQPKTKGGAYSTRMDDILRFAGLPGNAGQAARLRLRYQALMKYVSTYTTGLIAIADQYADKCLHTSYHQTGTDTQRFSSTFPNISNMPRTGDGGKSWREGLPDIRDALPCPAGWTYVIRDYSQIELKLVAHISRDPVLMRVYLEGGDIHQQTMDRLGCDRTDAKINNFSIIYRISANRLSIKRECAKSVAAKDIREFYRLYAGVKRYHERAIQQMDAHQYAPTLTGFKRWLDPQARTKDGESMRHLQENRAINTPIQGSAGGIIKLALIRLYGRWSAKGWLGSKAVIVGQTYDEIITRVRDGLIEEADADIKWAMEGAFKLRVPLTTEGGSGKTWSEAK